MTKRAKIEKTLVEATEIALQTKKAPKGELGKIARTRAVVHVPVHDDPFEELRRLTKRHAATMKAVQAMDLRIKDRKRLDPTTRKPTGEVIPCLLPEEQRIETRTLIASYKRAADAIARDMLRELKKTQVYQAFLSKVLGWGEKTAPYLVALIDFAKCEKPSNLRRFCGLGLYLDDKGAHAERARRGHKLGYCADIKRALYLWFTVLNKMGGDNGRTEALMQRSKYWRRFVEAKHAALSLGMPKGKATDKARRKMCDLFVEDLYIVGRALAGLPVWVSWYAKERGHLHGGKVAQLAPEVLTLEEALRLVGVADAPAVDLVTPEEQDAAEAEDEDERSGDPIAAE